MRAVISERRLRSLAVALAFGWSGAVAGCPHGGVRGVADARDPDDRDSDGLRGLDDLCPDAPEDRDAFEDSDGCPDPDNDHDGIADAADVCPNEPETRNGFEDADGCPDRAIRHVMIHADPTFAGIYFDAGSAELVGPEWDILDEAVDWLARTPFAGLELEGNVACGFAEEKPDLAFARANAVRDALIAKGVDTSRLAVSRSCIDPGSFGPDVRDGAARVVKMRPVLPPTPGD